MLGRFLHFTTCAPFSFILLIFYSILMDDILLSPPFTLNPPYPHTMAMRDDYPFSYFIMTHFCLLQHPFLSQHCTSIAPLLHHIAPLLRHIAALLLSFYSTSL